jgi:hypothetical protein
MPKALTTFGLDDRLVKRAQEFLGAKSRTQEMLDLKLIEAYEHGGF